MKRFSPPGACSLSPRIVPREAGLPFQPFPAPGACQARVAVRPAVQESMAAERLVQK